MSQQFLNQLLRIENTVQVDEHEAPTCMICLESYGTLNPSTGAVELQVRLPCNHLVGTVCIGTWLEDHNSCPACRAILFPAPSRSNFEREIIDILLPENTRSPAPSRSNFEREIIDILQPENTRRMGGRDESEPTEICSWLCEQLRLRYEILEMAQSMTDPVSRRLQGFGHLPECIAAISVYIAWHLLNRGVDVASSLSDLVRVSQLDEDHIRDTYRRVYSTRMELIVPEVLSRLARLHMESILAFLPTPDAENAITNSEANDDGEGRTRRGTSDETDEDIIKYGALRRRLHEKIGDVDLVDVVERVYSQFLYTIDDHPELAGRSCHIQTAVYVFMACHLMGVEISYSDAAYVNGVDERLLRQRYTRVFPQRREFINSETIEIMGTDNPERVLSALPALNWPSL